MGAKDALPVKVVDEVVLQFSPPERDFYDGLYQKSIAEFDGFAASGTLANNYATLLTLLLRLRQACNHPQDRAPRQ